MTNVIVTWRVMIHLQKNGVNRYDMCFYKYEQTKGHLHNLENAKEEKLLMVVSLRKEFKILKENLPSRQIKSNANQKSVWLVSSFASCLGGQV